MEIVGIVIGAFATLVGIIAGMVQVVQYIQERKKKKLPNSIESHAKSSQADGEGDFQNPLVKQNLPHARRFIGREVEIEKIMAILLPYPHSQEHLISIDGVGGIGKSALAIEVAHRLLRQYPQTHPDERFEAFIWTSAKKDLLTADGIFPRTQIIRTLEQVYIVIAFMLGYPEITHLKMDEQSNAIRKLLSQQRILLIVDNFETVDDEEMISFLRELPAPTKCIVTSRHRIDVAYPVRLLGMSEREANLLINSECLRHGISISTEDAKQLLKRTGGVPLAMVLSIAQIAKGIGVKVILDHLGKYTDDITRFCFDYSLEKLNANERKLLMALSLFSEGTTREFLGEISELSELDRDQGLAELEKLSLINRSSNKFWMLPLSLEYVHAKMLEAPPEITAKLKHNFAKAYLNIKIESTEAAKVRIQAVHLAIDLSDLIVWDTVIADYLSANRRAINRGIAITRIFILERELTYLSSTDSTFHPEIRRILDEQLQTGIDVRILWWDATKENKLAEPADLIIFDGNEVHIHKGHGGWYPDVQITTDAEEVKLWGRRFSQWMEFSQQWHVMRRE